MPITTYEGLLEAWANEAEAVEQNLEDLYGPATITPVLPPVTTEEGMLEEAAEGTELAAWNFAKMYNYMSTETNTTRIVDVPDTALFYGQIVKIGGKTVVESDKLMSAEVTHVISKKADGSTLQSYSIPAEIMEINGYGNSAGNVYNYVDYDNKKFVKSVISVTFNGTEDWGKYVPNPGTSYYYLKVGNNGDVINHAVVCDSFQTVEISGANADIGIDVINSSGYNAARILVRPADVSGSKDDFKQWLSSNNITVNYAVSTPIETDISAYLNNADIKVEAGGTLTFVNSNDLDVPSEVKYML